MGERCFCGPEELWAQELVTLFACQFLSLKKWGLWCPQDDWGLSEILCKAPETPVRESSFITIPTTHPCTHRSIHQTFIEHLVYIRFIKGHVKRP